MLSLSGKRALVTGASRGIGRGIALSLAEAGANVAITYASNGDKARAVVDDIKALGREAYAIQADNRDANAIKAAVDQAAQSLGGLDILVNNAGVFPYGPLEDVSVQELDEALAINTRAVFLASQAALAHMGEGGRIISTSSSLATRVWAANMTLYAMTKSALIGFTKGLARDLGPRGITVNTIDPGSTDTDMNPADGPSADIQRSISALGHYADVKDMAAAVVFLASDQARFITGVNLLVDGGANA